MESIKHDYEMLQFSDDEDMKQAYLDIENMLKGESVYG
jgi:hypothetical protein